jgi:putative ABC transport system permease protein
MIFLRPLLMPLALIYQSVALALGHIFANKIRAMLTTIGIVIGVASVTAVIAAMTGLKQNVLSEFDQIGPSKLFIYPEQPDSGPMRNASFNQIRFTAELFDDVLELCPSVKEYTRMAQEQYTIGCGTRTLQQVDVTGIDPAWHEINNCLVSYGRPFSMIDNLHDQPVCLVNPKLQEKLHLDRDCTGQSIVIDGRRHMIVGVTEPRPEGAIISEGANDAAAYVPFNTLYSRSRFKHPFMYVVATAKNPDVAEEAQAEVRFYLRKKRQLPPGDPDTFGIEVMQKYIKQFDELATTITLVAGGIVGISLIVGGVGIMNIMLVSVSERTREIGLRKAVGARPAAILLQFLIEAVTLCLFGGLLGVAAGEGLTYGLTRISGLDLSRATIPLWAIALSFGFAAAVGLIFGMFPAIKASRLDPIEALRHE